MSTNDERQSTINHKRRIWEMAGATRELAEFLGRAGPESLPAGLYDLAKICVLDTVGVTLFGSTKPWSKLISNYGYRNSDGASRRPASVLGSTWCTTPALAALINGSAGHAFELDDVHDESLLHPGVVVVPAALAVGEDVQASGVEFLTSVIVGYELVARIGLAVGSVAHMLGGFHSTGTNGVFGSTAAAAKLLNLNTNASTNAIGIAGSMASGLMEFSLSGGMVKRLHAGRAAEGGVLSTYLAGDGFTGPPTVLEGPYGYLKSFSSASEPERLLMDLGEKYAIEEVTIKPYACCSDLHATIDCIRSIREQADIKPEQVKHIRIHVYEKLLKQNTLDGSASVEAAQYSVLFVAAAAFFHDLGDPNVFSEEVISDPRIAELARNVEVRLDPSFEALYPRKMPTRVDIELVNGNCYTAEVVGAKGHFENPLTQDEIEAKFRALALGVLPSSQVRDAIDAIKELDSLDSLGPLMKAVTPPAPVRRNYDAAV